jgi:DNA-binding beta-propeller fold protein YncE
MNGIPRLRKAAIVVLAAIGLCILDERAGSTAATVDHDRCDHSDLPKGSVWVVNRDRGELAIFDAETGAVLATLPVGAGAHDICISERARKAYITAETINTVTTVDTRTLAMDSIPVGPLPHHCEPSPDGRTMYVSLASHTSTVGVPEYAAIDTRDNSVTFTPTSANPLARAHGLHPSIDGERVYVSHDMGNELSAIDVDTDTVDFSISPILRAEEAIASRFGRRLWVSSRGDGTVKRIDLRTNTITGSVSVGIPTVPPELVQPESVMLTPSERTLVVSLRASPAVLAFVDTRKLKLADTVPIGGAGTFGDLAVMTRDGRYVFATFDADRSGTGGVAVVDVRRREVVSTWAYPGTGRPHGIWYSRMKPRL